MTLQDNCSNNYVDASWNILDVIQYGKHQVVNGVLYISDWRRDDPNTLVVLGKA